MAAQIDTGQSVALRHVASDSPDYRHYRPLDIARREIRVLEFESESTCTLRHVSLNDRPSYFALSYYWGPETSTEPLCISQVTPNEAQVVHIRRTLAGFLRNLFRKLGLITVWLDVICINQRSFDEQAAQVALMGEIYSLAGQVYSWMGEWDPDIDYLFHYCLRLSDGVSGLEHRVDVLASAVRILSARSYWTRYVFEHLEHVTPFTRQGLDRSRVCSESKLDADVRRPFRQLGGIDARY
jgi:hypothetical protein